MRIDRAGTYVGVLAVVVAAAGLLGSPALAQRGTQDGEWPNFAGNREGMKYSPLDQITKDNVDDLEVAWRWPTADRELQASNPAWRGGRYEDTPLMINGLLYTVTPLGLIAALDPATGETRWVHDPQAYTAGRPANVGFLHRGLSYWTDGTEERLVLGTNDARLVSIDARTGEPDPEFGVEGKVDIMVGIRDAVRGTNFAARRSLIAGDVVVVGNAIADGFRTKEMPPGDVQAYDVRTGRKLWTFHTIPKEYEAGYETWLNGSAEYTGNANVWNGMAYDPELDYVYLPTSTPTHNEYGGNRHGDNLYAESLVCVDARTGERIWHFQAVHHGVWDYDFATRPILADITVDGRPIKAIIQVSKQAFTYVFDRATGEPVWPIEERPVPQSTVPGERTAPTQPFPSKPPPFDLQGTTEDNLLDFTPELRRMALERLQTIRVRAAVHAAVGKGHHLPARPARRIQLGRRGLRPRDLDAVCAVADGCDDVSHDCGRPGPDQPGLRAGPPARHPRVDAARRPAAVQAAILAHDRHRHEPRRDRVDLCDGERSPQPSAAAGPRPAAARQPGDDPATRR